MIGLGTYAYFWQSSTRVENPMSLRDMLTDARELGVTLFQICDWAPLESHTAPELADLAALARDLEMELELGTKGITPERLARFLTLSEALDARLVRSMLHSPDSRPTTAQSIEWLSSVAGDFEKAGVTLALETYEQVGTTDLVDVVTTVGSSAVGICLDPGNVVARLEHPRTCVETAADYVVNVHVKDFAFSRQDGWVGFTYSGAPMGTGLHDYPHLLQTVDPRGKGISEIIEHWLGWQDDSAATVAAERAWTAQTLSYLRASQAE